MDHTHHAGDEQTKRDDVDNKKCDCQETEEGTAYYVLMNSAQYGTEAWPCTTLNEAVGTLAALARSAEERRRRDGIQRFFCIKGETFLEGDGAGADVPDPDPCSPDKDAATLILHLPHGATAGSDSRRSRLRLRIQDAEEAERTPAGRGPGTPSLAGTDAERRRALRRHSGLPCRCGCEGQVGCGDRAASRTEGGR